MWSFRIIFLLAGFSFLGGCGFQPLYGKNFDAYVPVEFAAIKIKPIRERIGQQLHNHLLSLLNPGGRPKKPRYVLAATVSESIASLGVRKSAFATRANLTLRVNYQLSPISGGKFVLLGNEAIIVSYNILDSDFATLMAEKDARARAVQELALAIRVHLAAQFTVRTPKKNSKKKEKSRR
jgi:LPS-assembly lipoprotein